MTADIGDEDKLRELTKIIEDLFKGFSVSNYRVPVGSSSPEEMAWRAAVEAWFFQEIMVFRRDLEHLLATLPDIIGSDPSEVLDLSGCAHIEANLDGRKYVITIMPQKDDESSEDSASFDFSGIDFDDWDPEAEHEMIFNPDFLEEWE
jgi:hypothetical protein